MAPYFSCTLVKRVFTSCSDAASDAMTSTLVPSSARALSRVSAFRPVMMTLAPSATNLCAARDHRHFVIQLACHIRIPFVSGLVTYQ